MRIGFAGSSMNNRYFISGSAVPMAGLMSALRSNHEVYWLEAAPDEAAIHFSPVPVVPISRSTMAALPNRLQLDLIVIQSWADFPMLLARNFRKAGTKVFFWDDNTPYAMSHVLRAVPYVDVILSHGDGAARILRECVHGVPIEVFYFASDPARFRPEYDAQFAADVSFVGTHIRERTAQLEWLFFQPSVMMKEHAFALYGSYWQSWKKLGQYAADYRGWVSNDILHKVYASSRITVNATKRKLRTIQCAPSNRVFDVMSSGGVLVSDPLPGIEHLFTPNEQLFVVENRDDAIAVLRRLINDPTYRDEVSQAAREIILSKHTWQHRQEQLLSLM